MNTMKSILAVTAMAEYSMNFWDAMKSDNTAGTVLNTAADSNGAYYLPQSSETDFRSAVKDNAVMRNLATEHRKYEGSSVIWAYDSDDCAEFVEEGEPVPGSDVKDDFTQIRINSYKLASLAKASGEFVHDAGFDIKKYVIGHFGKSFAKAEDKAFINGTGVDEPTGLLHATAGAETADTVESLTYDDCINLFFSIKPEYRKNAVWLMNDSTALTLRKLKDEDGNYLWNSVNDIILGRPVYICNEMPDADAGEKPVAFGDMSYYWIIDRTPASFKVLHELYAAKDQVGYIGYERLDGRLIRSDAVKVIKMADEEETV